MPSKIKILNYITFALASITIFMACFRNMYGIRKRYITVMVIITAIIYFINKNQMDNELNLSKNDRKKSNEIKEKMNENSSNSRKT